MLPIHVFPGWLKWLLAGLITLWLPVQVHTYGAANVLWLCEVGNILLVVAVWRESRLILSALLVGLLLVDFGWALDLLAALATGGHPFGATQNMFHAAIPLPVRIGSLFHLAVPAALLFAVRRMGYDRRGFLLQASITAMVLLMSFLFTPPAANVNWVWGPGFGAHQEVVPPLVYVVFCMVAYPVLLYLPVHVVALIWTGQPVVRIRGHAARAHREPCPPADRDGQAAGRRSTKG